MKCRRLAEEEKEAALQLIRRTYMKYDAPYYSSDEPVEYFLEFHQDPDYTKKLRWYGAFLGKKLLGVLATRQQGTHIALVFIENKFWMEVIAYRLLKFAVKNCMTGRITVNATPFAVPHLRHFGFRVIGEEQLMNGLRYIPMEYRQR